MIDGYKVEKQFIKDIPSNWKFIREANYKENVLDHWDVLVEVDGKEITLDIKAHKASKRNKELLHGMFWIEWKNVLGCKGWLLGGADYIAFEYYNEYRIYNRNTLANFCKELVDLNKIVSRPEDALECVYQRAGRLDMISLVKIDDLPFPNYIIKKPE